MNYCKYCKKVAKESETTCSNCGKPTTVFGSSPAQPQTKPQPQPSPPRTAPASSRPVRYQTEAPPRPPGPGTIPGGIKFTLQGEVERLEQVQKKNVNRGRFLGLLSVAATVAILFILYQVYARTVLAYAELSDIKITQDPNNDWMVNASYSVNSIGKVAFDRLSGSARIEKLDLFDKTGPQGFGWTWPWGRRVRGP